MIPVLLRFLRDPAHRDALRAANGVHLDVELGRDVALTACLVVCTFVVIGVALSGC